MAILPQALRFSLFDALSRKTMRYVEAVPRSRASGLVRQVYEQVSEDFFVNGSLTSRSKVPAIFAAIWTAGRETILVEDRLDRTTKEAIAATLSAVNDCPYCGDMLVSLVHASDQHEDARAIHSDQQEDIVDPVLRDRLSWVKAAASADGAFPDTVPFCDEEMPEVLGSILAMGDINAFSHVVMDGSPVNQPLGSSKIKSLLLRLFGNELVPTQARFVEPGRTLSLLPPAELPEDLAWARPNPRIADALAQYARTIEVEAAKAICADTRRFVSSNLAAWDGRPMPISRAWIDHELAGQDKIDRELARLALVLTKARYHLDEDMVQAVVNDCNDDATFIRVLAWCSFTAARHQVARIVRQLPSRRALAA